MGDGGASTAAPAPPRLAPAVWIGAATSAAAACLLFGANLFHQVGSPWLLWIPPPVSGLLVGWACRWVAGLPQLTPPARRFWNCFALTGALVGVGMAFQAYDALLGPGAPKQEQDPFTLIPHSLAVAALMWGMARLPLRAGNRAERLTLILDISAVMLTTGLFVWHFYTGPALTPHKGSTTALVVALSVVTIALVAVFAIVKVVLSGIRIVDTSALRVLAFAVSAAAIGSIQPPWLEHRPYLLTVQYVVPMACLLCIWAVQRQARTIWAEQTAPTRRPRRNYSVLPYLSVAATDGLLLWVVARHDGVPLIAGGAVALTLIVVARQVVAFRENARLLETLSRHERRFRSLVQNGSDIILITGPDGRLSYISPSMQRVLGWSPEQWLGRPTGELLHPEDIDLAQRVVADLRHEAGATTVNQARLAHRDGGWRWVEVTTANLLDDPSVQGVITNARDITEARRFQERLRHEATHDALTGLANRALFGERLETALAGTAPGLALGVALIDLNDFKVVNDTLGHGIGDLLLMVAAERLRESVRPGDLVARLGGDEFAVVFENITATGLDLVVGRIADTFAQPVEAQGHDLSLRASIGVTSGYPGMDVTELLRQADVAMYAAKAVKGGPHVHYSPALSGSTLEQSRLGTELRRAVAEKELRLVYQPVVTLPDGVLVGVEALVRWQHPERGLLGPAEFITAAERSGLVVPLGSWVLGEACRQLAAWDAQLGPAAPDGVSVNVSVVQLKVPQFSDEVAAVLAGTGLAADRLTLEITESIALAGEEELANLARLRSAGVHIALDDFGTGESSLVALDRSHADELKLDRSFVARLSFPEPGVAAALATFAATLGLRLVAEGVETSRQAEQLHALGYRLAQGYYFSRPLPAVEIARLALSARAA